MLGSVASSASMPFSFSVPIAPPLMPPMPIMAPTVSVSVVMAAVPGYPAWTHNWSIPALNPGPLGPVVRSLVRTAIGLNSAPSSNDLDSWVDSVSIDETGHASYVIQRKNVQAARFAPTIEAMDNIIAGLNPNAITKIVINITPRNFVPQGGLVNSFTNQLSSWNSPIPGISGSVRMVPLSGIPGVATLPAPQLIGYQRQNVATVVQPPAPVPFYNPLNSYNSPSLFSPFNSPSLISPFMSTPPVSVLPITYSASPFIGKKIANLGGLGQMQMPLNNSSFAQIAMGLPVVGFSTRPSRGTREIMSHGDAFVTPMMF